MTETKSVTITKTVPVIDKATLTAWLNQELKAWLTEGVRGMDSRPCTAGSKAIDLIEEAGFKLAPPVRNRVEP